VRPPIKDEFKDLPISRQRKYQLRMERDRRCIECGKPAAKGLMRCLKHIVRARERARATGKWKRRYQTISYRLEGKN
jgi:hypothetical protein